jgi:hypothetical protein
LLASAAYFGNTPKDFIVAFAVEINADADPITADRNGQEVSQNVRRHASSILDIEISEKNGNSKFIQGRSI